MELTKRNDQKKRLPLRPHLRSAVKLYGWKGNYPPWSLTRTFSTPSIRAYLYNRTDECSSSKKRSNDRLSVAIENIRTIWLLRSEAFDKIWHGETRADYSDIIAEPKIILSDSFRIRPRIVCEGRLTARRPAPRKRKIRSLEEI